MTNDFFTQEERNAFFELQKQLFDNVSDNLSTSDIRLVKEYLQKATQGEHLQRDVFGLNPILTDAQTAAIVAQEVGLSRAFIIAIMLSSATLAEAFDLETIQKDFGSDVSTILHGMLRIRHLYEKSASIDSDNFRSLLVTFAEDMRVILIMIANCVSVMRQIKDSPNDEARRQVSNEAANLYAPLAHKLGLYKLKSELEDLSLKYLEHDAYYHIKDKLNETKRSRDAYIKQFVGPIEEKLKSSGLRYHMKGRTKSIHSIWQKMKKQHVDVDGVFDLFAIRIILDSPLEREKMECWQVFSIITDMYQSNPKRMRDWLSVPKSNGYESLHITVLGPGQKWVEVQIRTERMDDVAEHGLAAHWRYKGIHSSQGGVDDWLANIRNALEAGDDAQMMQQFRMDLVEDEVFVFTPKGDLFKLPLGATVLDFAYAIHTKVGNHCTGARIGNRNVNLRYKLQSGDQVEILTQNNQSPKQDWLGIVTTGRARSKIRQSLKEMQAGKITLARELVERKMKNRKVEYVEATFMHTIKRMGFKVVTDFYQSIAEEKLDINQFLETYLAQQRHDRGEENSQTRSAGEFEAPSIDTVLAEAVDAHPEALVIDDNLRGLDYQLARCCRPIYGDPVFGFVNSSGGIRIHRTDCPNAQQMRTRWPYRVVNARWASKSGNQYSITLHIVGQDDMGIVNNITSVISKEERMLMRSISIDSHDGLFSGHLTVVLEDTDRLAQLIRKLQNIKGVKNVTRI